jgi:hypothetical protein
MKLLKTLGYTVYPGAFVYNRRVHIIQQRSRQPSREHKRKELSRFPKTGLTILSAAPLAYSGKEKETITEKESEIQPYQKQQLNNTRLLGIVGVALLVVSAILLARRLLSKRKTVKKQDPRMFMSRGLGEKVYLSEEEFETLFSDTAGSKGMYLSEREMYRRRLVDKLTVKLSDIPYEDYQEIMDMVSRHLSVGELMEILLYKKIDHSVEDREHIHDILSRYLTEEDRKELIKLINEHNKADETKHVLH